LVRVRIQAVTKPKTSAITVAASATMTVLSITVWYFGRAAKLSRP